MSYWKPSTLLAHLPADSERRNFIRKVKNASYSYVSPHPGVSGSLIHYSKTLAKDLNLSNDDLQSERFKSYLSGQSIPTNIDSYSMNYGGHQFGQWAGQLGDGRAINIGNFNGQEIQLKGAGLTPYSRNADGKAVLRSSIREYLMSEAMHHLGVPTTRALSLVEMDEKIERDMLYNGNPKMEKAAIIARVAPSFLRFGNFELHAAHKEYDILKKLADYTIQYHYPELTAKGNEKYISFFEKVMEKTLETLVHWQRIGFTHGVLNTDNMSILGLTIDYGPFGFLDEYEPSFTPNTTDFTNKRYRFENQPPIIQWNLLQLANALYPLVQEAKPFEYALNQFPKNYQMSYFKMMKSKLGLQKDIANDEILIQALEQNLQMTPTDYTLFFRLLSHLKEGENSIIDIQESFYKKPTPEQFQKWKDWLIQYQKRLALENKNRRLLQQEMRKVNPKYILRNYMLYQATENAEKGDYALINELYHLALKPYEEQPKMEKWFVKKPDWANNTIGCSVLSCSS